MNESYDIIIIGAGQAGLALGYYLRKSGLRFLLLESNKRVGDSWRKRYHSLKLFSPNRFNSLPGQPFPGKPDDYANKNEIAWYLENYATYFDIPVQTKTWVEYVEQTEVGFLARTNRGDYRAVQVVVAVGAYQMPYIPEFAQKLSPQVLQLHSSVYLNPEQISTGPVLVVGGGNSGAQIALELSQYFPTTIATRSPLQFLPHKILGKSSLWWGEKLGLLYLKPNSVWVKLFKLNKEPIIGTELKGSLRANRIIQKPEVVNADSEFVMFKNGQHASFKTIIWATGFRHNFSFIHIPHLFDRHGRPMQQAGISNISGLYFMGLVNMRTRSSALLRGVGKDAEFLARQIMKHGSRV